ncbi:hypothetical protein GCM10011613_25700 [Cellvibrio zantedeschiae]|uniref:Uncharacterized protein n=1 Tax=Cellvibrio zantedeschiae TaxID=1237077 RepID=A0ABQ3B4P4_9GAMM|nr:hypothetical protein [Cellvibrio zantedeschiae]GGY79652.1 hypothetical protein GCM10011613_25700 [Cellvibrio zantedeschiae]
MNNKFWNGLLVGFTIIVGGVAAILWYGGTHNAFTFEEISNALQRDFDKFSNSVYAIGMLAVMQPLIIFIARKISRISLDYESRKK